MTDFNRSTEQAPASDLTVREQLDRRRVEAIQNEARRGAFNDARAAVAGLHRTPQIESSKDSAGRYEMVKLSDVNDALGLAEKGVPERRSAASTARRRASDAELNAVREAVQQVTELIEADWARVKPDPIMNTGPAPATERAPSRDDLADTLCFLRRHRHHERPSCAASRHEAEAITGALAARYATRAADTLLCSICGKPQSAHPDEAGHLFAIDI